ncbi:hypothetical protein FZI91_02080 [Mycobacterium sp. CBMA271]|uniref:MmpS family transport accessory protein n=1 Tax=unclassified Mycobacteroides TaxID=2618759 RepID=UPI0012DF3E46|nr:MULTISPECIES: MmpS family transport accessory protein [unclassified Mycobacteroides]MUM17925.1 hypothetical protein [Mycobacteroides sp. CBMA 326]MUM20494.1 hypothetical protein [Mycobacteroides sp. CBMA 271]
MALAAASLITGLATAVGATAFGASLTITPQPPERVLYVVTSERPVSQVSWRDSRGILREQHDANTQSTWYWTFTSTDANPHYFVSAQSGGGSVTCRLIVNDKVKVENNGAGPNSTATCQG